MSIVAGLLVQNALKHLLNFGDVATYVGYAALSDFFPKYTLKPNIDCVNSFCKEAQISYKAEQEKLAKEKIKNQTIQEPTAAPDENEWMGISVVDSSDSSEAPQQASVKVSTGDDLSSLMNQLKSLSTN